VQEFVYTIIAIWLIWKLFGAFSNRSGQQKSSRTYSQTNHNYYNTPRPGDVRVEEVKKEKAAKNSSDGDYVDYEEIK
jgi:hypothetical protein